MKRLAISILALILCVGINAQDTISPTAICKDTTVYLNSNGIVNINSSFIDNGSSDNVGIQYFTLSKYQFNCSNIGVNNIQMIVIDYAGNRDTCSSIVTVIDTITPKFVCKDTITIYTNDSGFASLPLIPNSLFNSYTLGCGTIHVNQTQYYLLDPCASTEIYNSVAIAVCKGQICDTCYTVIKVIEDTNHALPLCHGDNGGVECGTFKGWTGSIGDECNIYPGCIQNEIPGIYTNPNVTVADHSIVTGGNDALLLTQGINLPMKCPFPEAGGNSIKLGNSLTSDFRATTLTHSFVITPKTQILTYSYAIVLEDPQSGHGDHGKPFFQVQFFDKNGNEINDS